MEHLEHIQILEEKMRTEEEIRAKIATHNECYTAVSSLLAEALLWTLGDPEPVAPTYERLPEGTEPEEGMFVKRSNEYCPIVQRNSGLYVWWVQGGCAMHRDALIAWCIPLYRKVEPQNPRTWTGTFGDLDDWNAYPNWVRYDSLVTITEAK